MIIIHVEKFQKYYSRPTSSTAGLMSGFELEFPAVTFCNMNPVRQSMMNLSVLVSTMIKESWMALDDIIVGPLSIHTHPGVFAFIPHTLCINRKSDCFWLSVYTFCYIFSTSLRCRIMQFKQTRHAGGVVGSAVAMPLCHYNVTRCGYIFWCHTIHGRVMNIHYQNWIVQGSFTNIIRIPLKQWCVCGKSVSCTEAVMFRFCWESSTI